MDTTACVNAAFPLPSILFTVGALAVLIYLKRKHGLGFVKTFMALIGAHRIKHDKVSASLALLTLVVPLVLWLYLGSGCS